jgi:hypothetical protein
MRTIYYAGTGLRISDDLAKAIQGYLVVLRFKPHPEWCILPGYALDSDNEIRADVQLVPNAPIVMVPTFPSLPDASGTFEVAAEIRKWTQKFLDNPANQTRLFDEVSEYDEHLTTGN